MNSIFSRLVLTESDILENEGLLCSLLGKFIKFDSHAVFFPREDIRLNAIPSERRLFLPLIWEGKQLGMLLLSGVGSREIKKLQPSLPHISNIILTNIALVTASRKNVKTGLETEETLFSHIENEMADLGEIFSSQEKSIAPLHRICFGMIVIAWHDARQIARKFDYELREDIYEKMAMAIPPLLPPGAHAAGIGRYEGRYEFGILLNVTGRKACQNLAHAILEKISRIPFSDPTSRCGIKPLLLAGHALYPQDMLGEELALPIFEQYLRLRDRARLASRYALPIMRQRIGIMSFAEIVQKGGRVIERAENGLIRINLGLAANAREGMRFNVIANSDEQEVFIGQIVLLQTYAKDSLAEIVYVEEAARLPEQGDLVVPADKLKIHDGPDSPDSPQAAEVCNILGHAEFLRAFEKISADYSRFVLGISMNNHDPSHQESDRQFFKIVEDALNGECAAKPVLAGRYGSNGFIFFHPGADAASCKSFYELLADYAGNAALSTAHGLYQYPSLNFGKSESEACALKALEYATLLPPPCIGVLDTLALNISADKKFSLGDTFGAIEEYKLSLLADSKNAMARNSLGVAMAALGKLDEARKAFEQALDDCGNDDLRAKICYNLGTVFHKQEDAPNARKFYRKCLKYDNEYLFAWIRLGQISENGGKKASARKMYLKAATLAEGDTHMANLAQRHLARLEVRGERIEEASALLHDILLRNPRDSEAMLLLAQIYLDNDGDAAIAETLARQAIQFGGKGAAWKILARALSAQGKKEEARKAEERGE